MLTAIKQVTLSTEVVHILAMEDLGTGGSLVVSYPVRSMIPRSLAGNMANPVHRDFACTLNVGVAWSPIWDFTTWQVIAGSSGPSHIIFLQKWIDPAWSGTTNRHRASGPENPRSTARQWCL
jgi:hypothetical protein